MKVGLIATSLTVPDAPFKSAEHLFKLSGGNTGNFAFVNAIYRHLAPNVEIFPWHIQPSVVKDRCDVVVIACANQLGRHTDLGGIAKNLDAMDLPIVALGLGAQSADASRDVEISAGTRKWMDVIAAHAPTRNPNIGVRGTYSLEQLRKLGYADSGRIIGCPSNFTNPVPGLGAMIRKSFESAAIERIAVPAGLHLWTNLQKIEEQLADLVDAYNGTYVAQSELDMLRLAREEFSEISPDDLEKLNAYIRPHLTRREFTRWCRRHMAAYIDAPSWIAAMTKFDFVVGPRFHGVMMAIQAGVPGGVISHDSRTTEMCETTGIPFVDARSIGGPLRAEDLKTMFPFDGEAYDRRRCELAESYLTILNDASIGGSEELKALGSAGSGHKSDGQSVAGSDISICPAIPTLSAVASPN
jgi:hypothetical protein